MTFLMRTSHCILRTMKLYIFDVDGTLEDESRITLRRKEAQYERIAKDLKTSIKDAKIIYWSIKEKMPKNHSSVMVMAKLGYTRKEFFRLMNTVDQTGLIELLPGAKEMLEHLYSNNILVAYSNTPLKSTSKTLRLLGIRKYFKKVYAADMFNESKPSTGNLKTILREQKFKAKDCVAIGDSYYKDILPAKSLGIKTKWVKS